MKTLSYLLLMLLAVSFMACEEEDDLPKPTQTGAGTMAAKINGKVWVHKSRGVMGGGGIDVDYNSDKSLSIIGTRLDDYFNNTVWLKMANVDQVGDYVLRGESSGSYGAMHDYREENNSKAYETTASSMGTVTITKLDRANKIISGTFSFRAPNLDNPSKFVEVTDGWFDVKYVQ